MHQENLNVVDINYAKVEELKAQFNLHYSRCFGEISSMLRKARVMPIVDLASHNPSFTQMVIELKAFRDVAEKLSKLLEIGEDFTKLDRCIELVQDLATSIESQCPVSLGSAVAELDLEPHI